MQCIKLEHDPTHGQLGKLQAGIYLHVTFTVIAIFAKEITEELSFHVNARTFR